VKDFDLGSPLRRVPMAVFEGEADPSLVHPSLPYSVQNLDFSWFRLEPQIYDLDNK
jgi:hypothetical protein